MEWRVFFRNSEVVHLFAKVVRVVKEVKVVRVVRVVKVVRVVNGGQRWSRRSG